MGYDYPPPFFFCRCFSVLLFFVALPVCFLIEFDALVVMESVGSHKGLQNRNRANRNRANRNRTKPMSQRLAAMGSINASEVSLSTPLQSAFSFTLRVTSIYRFSLLPGMRLGTVTIASREAVSTFNAPTFKKLLHLETLYY